MCRPHGAQLSLGGSLEVLQAGNGCRRQTKEDQGMSRREATSGALPPHGGTAHNRSLHREPAVGEPGTAAPQDSSGDQPQELVVELVAAATMAPRCTTPAVAFPVRPGQPDDRPVRRPGAGAAGWRSGWPRAAYCLRRRAVQPSPGRRRRRPPASGPADSRPGQRLLLATVRLAGRSQPQQQEIELHAAIAERCTNRSPFSGRRPPPGVLAELAEAAQIEGAVLHVPDRQEARRLLRLAQDAECGPLRRGFPNAEQPPAHGRCRPRDRERVLVVVELFPPFVQDSA
jgi:hypothetical protein